MATDKYNRDVEAAINLTVLKKQDGNAERIIATASSVAHYTFDPQASEWAKSEIEGSLFVYSRSVEPHLAVFIMNRLRKENIVYNILPDMEFQAKPPFLLCRATQSQIIGIWFYVESELEQVNQTLNRLAKYSMDEAKLVDEISEILEDQQTIETAEKKVNVLDLLMNAMHAYEKDENKGKQNISQKPNQNASSKMEKKKSNRQRRVSEPESSTSHESKDICQQSFSEENDRTSSSPQRNESIASPNGRKNRSHTLPVATPEEQAPRRILPRPMGDNSSSGRYANPIDVASLEADGMARNDVSKETSGNISANQQATLSLSAILSAGSTKKLSNGKSVQRKLFQNGEIKNPESMNKEMCPVNLLQETPSSALLSPSAFRTPTRVPQPSQQQQQQQKSQQPQVTKPEPNALTKQQMRETLTYLIENDDHFLEQIYSIYHTKILSS